MRRNKFGAVKTRGFASKKEANRWRELELLQRAKLISGLTYQPVYDFNVNGHYIGKFTPDAAYLEVIDCVPRTVVEDTKGGNATKTEAYKLRVKLLKALFPDVVFREV